MKKIGIVRIIAIASLIIVCSSVIAAYWIYSPVMEVSLSNYGLSIAHTKDGLSCHISGQLTDPSDLPISGATIYIYLTSQDGTVIQLLGSTVTDSGGNYYFDWLASADATYWFKAGYQVG